MADPTEKPPNAKKVHAVIARRVRSIIAPLAVMTALIAGTATAQQTQPQQAPQGQGAAPMGGPGMGQGSGIHHQGAIDMARIELEHGKDPDLKAMAQKVIDEQTKEIQQLQDWMKQHLAKQAAK